MSFWGVQIQPEEPYTEPELEGTKLHVTHATLGLESKGKQRTVVKCEVGDRPEVLLCSLVPGVSESCSLDLLFDEEVVFTVSGDASVHLTGYYESHEDQDEARAADDYDSEEEDGYEFSEDDIDDFVDDEALVDDEYDDDYEDYDEVDYTDDVLPARSSVRIEEVNDEQPVSAAIGANKHLKAITDGSESRKRKNGANGSAVKSTVKDEDEDRSEDEDGFALPGKSKKAVRTLEQLPSKSPTVTKTGVTLTPSKTTSDVETPAEGKKKKKKKKKEKVAKAQASQEQIATKTSEPKADGDMQELGAVSKAADKTPAKTITEKRVDVKQGAVEKPRKDASGEKITQPAAASKAAGKAQAKTPIERRADAEQATAEKPSKKEGSAVKKYPNGLEIETIAMGKPDGKQAKPGKRVSMHYIGKLKSNGKIFDSNIGKKPFDFRLGVGEVIKGWDIGVNGMRVGDKRRLTIPPQMAYGPEGVKGTIPGNAWLTFDVELVNVK